MCLMFLYLLLAQPLPLVPPLVPPDEAQTSNAKKLLPKLKGKLTFIIGDHTMDFPQPDAHLVMYSDGSLRDPDGGPYNIKTLVVPHQKDTDKEPYVILVMISDERETTLRTLKDLMSKIKSQVCTPTTIVVYIQMASR